MPTWTSNIPSQVKPYANAGAFPATGSVKTIYIAEDTDIAYYWTGSAYQAISIQDLSGLQTIPIVVNSNITAQNDRVYHVVANATFTDPTPVEGKGYVVVVRGATATIGGNTGGAGTINYRLFHSGSWTTYQFWNINQLTNVFVPQTRTINGLDLTTNRTLTTANINDSANRRYVTDAQATVIGNTSGTNTGDETQSSINTKIGATGWIDYSGSTSLVGWSATTEVIIFYKKLDFQTVLVYFRITGTSNASNATFTIPFTAFVGFGNQIQGNTRVVNNGVARLGDLIFIESSNVIDIRPYSANNEVVAFTASGTKSIFGMVTLVINS